MNALDKDIDNDNKAELLQAARTAAETPEGFWSRVAGYFDSQRNLVIPRETRDNSATEGDS